MTHIQLRSVVMAMVFALAEAAGAADTLPLQPADPRCEYQRDPLGIDTPRPRLSWRLEAPDARGRDRRQTRYRVLVAGSTETLAADRGDLWDSGEVRSGESLHVEYGGRPLRSNETCWWKVRVWDERGRPSGWSPPARWTMGLLDPSDWRAKWIGLDEEPSTGSLSHRQVLAGESWIWRQGEDGRLWAPAGPVVFRRRFTLPPGDLPVRAPALMVADDRFELRINGRDVGLGGSFRTITEMDAREALRAGDNVAVVRVINGSDSPAGLCGRLEFEWSDGTTVSIATDGTWETASGLADCWSDPEAPEAVWRPAVSIARMGEAPWDMAQLPAEPPVLPARMLRREFHLDQPVAEARLYVCGLGFFELHVNGHRIGDHAMDPALTHYDHRVMYVPFDVTRELRGGANVIAVELGNGRFFAPRLDVPVPTRSWGTPRLLLQAELRLADGSTTRIVSDETWRVTAEGPVRASNEYDGEVYDARREMPGWTAPGFDDRAWKSAALLPGPPGRLMAQAVEPMRITGRLRPTRILKGGASGTWLVDMGQAFYGTFRMRVRGEAGTTVTLRSAYSLKGDGTLRTADNRSARCTDVYVLKGGGALEEWSPRFRGQGYRYLEVTGWPGEPGPEDFEGLVIHTDCELVGHFECSNELVNRIWRNVRWGQRSFLRSLPMDPDRDERQGWLGDPAKGAEGMAWNFRVARFFSKWLGDIRADQRPDGLVPDVVPSYFSMASGDVVWPSVVTIVPETLYDFYGDRRTLEENYDCMRRWMEFQRSRIEPDGTLPACPYGDWCDASGEDHGATSASLIATAYFAHNCRLMARTAGLLGREEDGRRFLELGARTAGALNARFFDPGSATYAGGTQCALLLPLVFDLVPETHRNTVARHLAEDILVRHRGHPSVGLVGMQWLMQGLADAGHPEAAWAVATRTEFPSWGYMISQGATTIWEHWDTDRRGPGMNSENLLILAGNVTGWMYRSLAGINPDPERPGFRHVVFRPHPVGDLRRVRAHHDSLPGRIVSEWTIEEGEFRLKVTVPPNVTATVEMPPGRAGRGEVHHVGSGEWSFTAPWQE